MEMPGKEWHGRLLKAIPWGSSTCSKASKWYPDEPSVIVRGKGCRVWDADGREFIDYRNGLGPVTLGYAFPAVDDAIRRQLADGIVYGHPHPLEAEVAERLMEIIPCAEQVRFLKTGGEAVAACVRLARAYTHRDHVIHIGYNGWLNALASGGRILPGRVSAAPPPGVPECLSGLHHAVGWNDIPGIEALFNMFRGRIAAVVVAADYAGMAEGNTFYPALRELTRREGTVLVFDEIVTGFRIAVGGVQEYFGVTPDMAVFAKGIANGMPLSAYVGRYDIMKMLETVIVSSTYGGEALTLAAARATIDTYRTENVIDHLQRQGETLWGGVNRLFERHGLPLRAKGLGSCNALVPQESVPEGMMERFFRAAYRNGVSLYTVNYLNYSHKDDDIAETLRRIDAAAAETINSGS